MFGSMHQRRGGACGELVSAVSSLIYRKSTGKFSKTWLPSWNQSRNSQVFPQPQRPIPCDLDQGIRFDEQGYPGRRHRLPSFGNGVNPPLHDLGRRMRIRPIWRTSVVGQVASFTSDLDRPSFGTLRESTCDGVLQRRVNVTGRAFGPLAQKTGTFSRTKSGTSFIS